MNEDDNASVLGIAYEIEEEKCKDTFKYLDFREKCGYSKHEVKFYPIQSKDSREITCICYYADETNKYYSKIINNDNYVADHIIESKGPSGTNLEYFLNVCNAIRKLIRENSASDDQNEFYFKNEKHLFELEMIVKRKIIASNKS
jgi:cation transport regulator ChaC